MPVNAEKEITKLWKMKQAAQGEICNTYYRWREFALEMAGEGADSLDVALKAAEHFGLYIGKGLLPRLNLLKGDGPFLGMVAGTLAGIWTTEGAPGKGNARGKTQRGHYYLYPRSLAHRRKDIWRAHGRSRPDKGEVVSVHARGHQPLLQKDSNIEMQKAIPRGEGEWVFKLTMEEK